MFQLWGTNWLMRFVLRHTRITARIEASVDEGGVTHINMLHTASPGGVRSTEFLTVNDQPVMTQDAVFGQVKRQAKFVRPADLSAMDPFLLTGWEDFDDELVLKTGFKQGGTEEVYETWGFQTINGTKYFRKNLLVRNDKEKLNLCLVYNYDGDYAATHQALTDLIESEARKQKS